MPRVAGKVVDRSAGPTFVTNREVSTYLLPKVPKVGPICAGPRRIGGAIHDDGKVVDRSAGPTLRLKTFADPLVIGPLEIRGTCKD